MIITHDKQIRADNILACVMLNKIFTNSKIFRIDDKSIIQNYINSGQVLALIDVFGRYEPEIKYFDTNHRDFNECINGVKCSSAGLIFKIYCRDLMRAYGIVTNYEIRALKQIYYTYIRMIDAKKNKIDIKCKIDLDEYRNSLESDLGIRKGRYSFYDENLVCMRTIADVVEECKTFEEAYKIVKKDFDNFMVTINTWITNYGVTKELLVKKLSNFDPTIKEKYREQILITQGMGNIGRMVCEIEKEIGLDIIYTIDWTGLGYCIYAVTLYVRGFKMKRPLKKEWMGLRNKKLQEISGIDGAKFVHSTGFMGMSKTMDDALEMCYKSLD